MKIFMHWDMEGATGLFERQETWYWVEGVPEEVALRGRQLLVADVNNAVRAALEAGVDEIIVSDTHRGGGNLIPEMLLDDKRVRYNHSSCGFEGGMNRWMPGLDETVDGFMVPAHHAKAGTPDAFLPHTNNSKWADLSINGVSVGEMGEESCYAAHWGVPLIYTHGDETFVEEARSTYPWIEAVAVKRALDADHAEGPDLATAHRLVAEGIRRSIEKLRDGRCKPFAPKLPMTVRVRMKDPADAEEAFSKCPETIERVDEHTLQGTVERYCDVLKWFNGTGLDMPSPE